MERCASAQSDVIPGARSDGRAGDTRHAAGGSIDQAAKDGNGHSKADVELSRSISVAAESYHGNYAAAAGSRLPPGTLIVPLTDQASSRSLDVQDTHTIAAATSTLPQHTPGHDQDLPISQSLASISADVTQKDAGRRISDTSEHDLATGNRNSLEAPLLSTPAVINNLVTVSSTSQVQNNEGPASRFKIIGRLTEKMGSQWRNNLLENTGPIPQVQDQTSNQNNQVKNMNDSDNPYGGTSTPPNMQATKTTHPQDNRVHVNGNDQGQTTGEDSGDEKKKEDQHRLLGIPGYQPSYSGNRNYDYTQKYPPDELGKEQGFRDTLDALLVFAALFSAVVTTFIVSTVVALQPDYAQITARLVLEQNQLILAVLTGNATTISSAQHAPASVNLDTADPSAKDLWVNGLFFASLLLSLATSLLSVLVKQWLLAYVSLPSGNAMERAKIRQFRYQGFKDWKVPEIIGALPLILHASLALFMIGLSIYVAQLHGAMYSIVVIITAFSFLMYLGSIFLPAITIHCPYRIPILFIPAHYCLWLFKKLYFWNLCAQWQSFSQKSITETEISYLHPEFNSHGDALLSFTRHHSALADCLQWLQSLESNSSIQQTVAQAVCGILKEQTQCRGALECYAKALDLSSIANVTWNALIHMKNRDWEWPSLCMEWKNATLFPAMEIKYSLHEAADAGYFHVVKVLVMIGENINMQGGYFGTALHAAAYRQNLEIVKYLVENGADVNVQIGKYRTPLLAAAYQQNLEIVKYLVKHGADVNVQGGKYGTALLAAVYPQNLVEQRADVNVQSGEYGTALQNLEIVKCLVEHGADVNVQGGQYGTALLAAVYQQNLGIVRYLVEQGADVNVQSGEYGTALQAAAYQQNLEIVKCLVEHGADVNVQGGQYGTALLAAVYQQNLGIVRYLVEQRADVNVQSREYVTALQAAAYQQNLEIVRCLVEHGADVNVQGGKYGTALYAAFPNLGIVKYLVEHGADVNVQSGEYGTALQAAASQQNLEIVKCLVEHGADINVPGDKYGTALYAAFPNLEIVKYMVEHGADVNMQGGEYGTVLQAAALTETLDIVKYLVEHGADVNVEGGKYGTALQAAPPNLEIFKYLVEHGADINVQGGEYGTTLQAAAFQRNLEIVRYLVEHGADVNVQGGKYGTALQAAAYRDNLEIVKYLVEHRADVNVEGGEYGIALYAAVPNLKIVKYLVEHGADINLQGEKYGTALQAAAYRENLEIVKYLVEHGADINMQGGKYGTALQAAAYRGHMEIFRYLVECGADLHLQGGQYGTALQAAAYRGAFDIVKYLVEHGADVNVQGGEYESPIKAAQYMGYNKIINYLQEKGARE
ncbi:hypothetical protein D9758_011921 [Tetrapyrgos nigripes]|uniref:DUF6535 domain-containing protein n=1 Tax=Tetrapyrgos nigripes TaxID=182062 RepID=A0A8H5D282_9AGAR|nr:hypothetical protein D9758_011921 [Tetrapyrgos nigripes]